MPDRQAHPHQGKYHQSAHVPGGYGPGEMARDGRAASPVAEPDQHPRGTESQPARHKPARHQPARHELAQPVAAGGGVRDVVGRRRLRPI